MAEATVTSVLRHIGLGSEAGHVWVDRDGRWQAGPLHGSWSKPVAQHIGHAARETERRRRLTELSDAIDKAVAVERAILNELEVLDGRNATIAQEAATVPSDEAVRRLQAELVASTKSVAAARLQLTEAESRVEKCRNQLTEITSARDRDAADMKLSAWVEKLNEFEELLAQYREHVAKLWPMLRSYLAVRSQSHTAVERARAAQLDEEQRLHLLSQARERAAAATAKHSVLEATRGADVARVLAELELARAGVKQIQKQRDEADGERVRASERLGGAKQNIDLLREMLEQQAGRREQAVELLKAYVAARLLATVHADLEQIEHEPWTITRAVEIARTIEALLGHVESDDAAWDRSQKDIHQYIEELKDTLLRHDYSPVTTTKADGLFVVTVPFLGRDCTMLEFRNELSAEIGARQSVLDAREREVLENHLIGEVATHLHDLLHKAEAWVRGMNDELHSRPTSTGMKLRFTWQPIEDGPPGLHEARRRLLGAGETWSPAERAALGEFLQMRIKDVRASNQVGTWHEHLAEALDYRRWHQFGVDRQQDGTWKRLTRKTYGTGSSGEKAIALTIPQFAAAAAHYRSADALAPRLILLDEAFVAVDNDMRGKCLGLLHAFDLDFVMTSEREWGCYPTVPALAIYQLSTLPGIDAVGVTRWVWNGRERIRDCTALPGACDPGTADVGGNGKAHGNGEA
ncbi:MAG: TIGR02680 family protein [Planctomycetes bacterium]|nr:TIGR02680 family protein [Planctomycetota bacterium]